MKTAGLFPYLPDAVRTGTAIRDPFQAREALIQSTSVQESTESRNLAQAMGSIAPGTSEAPARRRARGPPCRHGARFKDDLDSYLLHGFEKESVKEKLQPNTKATYSSIIKELRLLPTMESIDAAEKRVRAKIMKVTGPAF